MKQKVSAFFCFTFLVVWLCSISVQAVENNAGEATQSTGSQTNGSTISAGIGFLDYEAAAFAADKESETETETTEEKILAASADGQQKTSWLYNLLENKIYIKWILAGICLLLLLILFLLLKARRTLLIKNKLPKTFYDIHNHILPEVDDGAKDEKEFFALVTESYKQGVRYMIATPHYKVRHQHISTEDLMEIYTRLKQKVEKKYPGFRLYLGNELFYSEDIIKKLEKGHALTLADSRYVLVEFNPDASYRYIQNAVITLSRECYIPIIAHVERFQSVASDIEHVRELKDLGALLQINAESIQKCKKLLKSGEIDFVATDCHNMSKRRPNLKSGVYKMMKYCTKEELDKILIKNPRRILKMKGNKYGNESNTTIPNL